MEAYLLTEGTTMRAPTLFRALSNRRQSSKKRRQHSARVLCDMLEPRTLLSATLYVSPAATPLDSTHFHALQAALAVAVNGDTVVLQPGFSAGTFVNTLISRPSAAGATTLYAAAALQVGEVISVGALSASDTLD